MEQLRLFILVNLLDLKRYLKLSYGTQLVPLLQLVFSYNLVIWLYYTLKTRQEYRNTLFTQVSSFFSVFNLGSELKSLFRPLYAKDPQSLNARYYYRLYLGFLFIITVATVLMYLPYTWTDALGYHLLRLFALIPFFPRILALR